MKKFGADPLAYYLDSTDVASHLHTAAGLAQVELMEFLILGISSAFDPFPFSRSPFFRPSLLPPAVPGYYWGELSIQIELTPT